MFEKIRQWLGKKVNSIVGTQDLFDALGVEVPVSDAMQKALSEWIAMHEDQPVTDSSGRRKKSMNLFAGIVTAVSQSVTIEMKSEISGSPRADYMNEIYQEFLKDKQNIIEFACARGDYIFKPSVTRNGLIIDKVKAGNYWPLSFDSNGYCTAALFLDKRVRKDKIYVRGEVQRLENDVLTITNTVVVSDLNGRGEASNWKKAELSVLDEWKELTPGARIQNVFAVPWGQCKMPFANVVDSDSPLGVSICSRAVELIRDANEIYDDLNWEFESGQRKLYVDETAFLRGKDGRPILPNDRLYKTLNMQKSKDEGLFEQWTPEFREQSYLTALNLIVSKIEDVCGLARGFLSSELKEEARTATEIKILKQRTYVTVDAIQQAFKTALERLAAAMDFWITVYNLAPPGEWEQTFDFDNSIIEDEEQQRQFDWQLVREEVLPKSWFLEKYYRVTNKEALKLMAQAQKERSDEFDDVPGEE